MRARKRRKGAAPAHRTAAACTDPPVRTYNPLPLTLSTYNPLPLSRSRRCVLKLSTRPRLRPTSIIKIGTLRASTGRTSSSPSSRRPCASCMQGCTPTSTRILLKCAAAPLGPHRLCARRQPSHLKWTRSTHGILARRGAVRQSAKAVPAPRTRFAPTRALAAVTDFVRRDDDRGLHPAHAVQRARRAAAAGEATCPPPLFRPVRVL